jgi:hypothetical protein
MPEPSGRAKTIMHKGRAGGGEAVAALLRELELAGPDSPHGDLRSEVEPEIRE